MARLDCALGTYRQFGLARVAVWRVCGTPVVCGSKPVRLTGVAGRFSRVLGG